MPTWLGIPVAVLGIVGYAAILLSLRMRVDVTALLAYLALAFSAYLTWAEVFQIDAICQWCVTSAIITLVIAGLATVRALGAPLHQRALSRAVRLEAGPSSRSSATRTIRSCSRLCAAE